MTKRIFVSLEVDLEDTGKPDIAASALFDWACMIATPDIYSINSYDYTVERNPDEQDKK